MRVHRMSNPDHPPMIGLSADEAVRHRREPSLGAGKVLGFGHDPKQVLVSWAAGIETYHSSHELERLDHARDRAA